MDKVFKIFILVLLSTSQLTFTQIKSEVLKRQAVILMTAGRYSEAIDQLHKYIASNPREADGYHKRALCYEQRTEYQYSVLDLRRARNLDPTNSEIQRDLSRVITIWHKLLYLKIEGHTRDIAIDPNHAFSYLEIGKSYRWLEEWSNAEIWYDEYLKRDNDASPDEIIRYTEILAKTGSITKGERILKKYTERYPDDWRIWSRYGYFTLWLGKYKIAEDAFKISLGFKPFFKEAQDGLDLAEDKAYLTRENPRSFEREEFQYPIDRFYRLLDKDPENDLIRFNLVTELIAANRTEEAFQQLQYLQPKHAEEENFKSLWKNLTEFRDSTFNKNVELYTRILKDNPSDKETVMKLAAAYANLLYYDSAIEILIEYLHNVPEDQDLDARFRLAQYSGWNYEWEKAIAQIEKLLQYDPNNLEYQLLRGQIAVWTVHDLDLGEKYLLNVVTAKPKELNAFISLVSLYSWKKNFPEAEKYLNIAKAIAPNNPEVQNAQSNYEIHLAANQEQQVFEMKAEAAKLVSEGKCDEALAKFDEYKTKRTGLTRDEMVEYAQIATCAKNFTKAIELYNILLAEQFDYSIALQRAKNYYYNQDSSKAFEELESLGKINPDDEETKLILADSYTMTNQLLKAEKLYRELKLTAKDDKQIEQIDQRMIYLGEYYIKDNKLDKAEEIFDELDNRVSKDSLKKEINLRRLFLGDAYVMAERYRDAKSIYKNLLDISRDTSEQRILKERISWLPPSGISRGFSSIGNFFTIFLPTNIGLSPFSTFFRDNQKFQLWNYGFRLDGGYIGFLSLGAMWSRTNLNNSIMDRNFTQFKGVASIFLLKNLILSGSYGVLKFFNNYDKFIGDISLRYESPNEHSFIFSYENNDAVAILYSPNLINTRININHYRFNGSLNYYNMFFSGFYNYYNLGDNNEGNDLQIRIGKKFLVNGVFGYEYFFSDFAFVSPIYYSPQNFDSHSIWGELNWQIKNWKLKAGAKVGYVPKVDYILSEIFGEAIYNPILSLVITGRLSYGNSFRYDSSYKSFTASVYAYWGIY